MQNHRPISPHLQIYNIFSKEMTSSLSIIHRITGVGLTLGLLYVAIWLFSAALGESSYNSFLNFITSWFGYLSMVFITVALYFHVANGIRFLLFALGYLLTKKLVLISGWYVIIITIILFLVTWYFILKNNFL